MAVTPSVSRHSDRHPRQITDPRAAALTVLKQLGNRNTTLDHILDTIAPAIDKLSRRDRALFNQLVYGVLRWRLRLDAVIDTHANRPLKKIAPTVLNILRLGLFQILFMDRIPSSAAVNASVNLVRTQRASSAAGFVNAVLRSALRNPQRFRLPDAGTSPVEHLALSAALPHWLAARWIKRMGFASAGRLCDAINTIPPISLRCNGLKNELPELVTALSTDAQRIDPMPTVPGGVNLIGPRRSIPRMQAFAEGRFAVQDGAAQLVSFLLAPRPGEQVLDACAGLGGKTTHLAQIMRNQGRIIALDHDSLKLTRLEAAARRLGVAIIDTQTGDLNQPPAPRGLPRFDRVLLDAPCSGLGVLRRNPDAKWSSRKADIARCADRQVRFLDGLAPLVKPGGILVFAVCSMEPEENEQVIARFLKKHANFAISASQAIEAASVQPFIGRDRFFRTAPHINDLDGFFAARLRRRD
jgi:16S rRNA (cytosine967-C5)-methyltransferase